MSDVPDDLNKEVLISLPVKSLLRFRCVCKSWYEIICTRDFIYSHLDKSCTNKQHRKMIQIRGSGIHNFRISALDINNGIQERFTQNFDMPLGYLNDVASCNGLVLFNLGDYQFSVWNPSTRHYRELPYVDRYDARKYTFGFGYNTTTDDYKVFIIVFPLLNFLLPVSSECEVWIFGFKSGRWRMITDFPSHFSYVADSKHSFVDGCVHFLCENIFSGSKKIMAFDVAKETFYVVPLPTKLGYDPCLKAFEGCLSFKICIFDRADMYVRKKEDGVEFTWTKLFSVTTQQSLEFGLDGRQFNIDFTPLGYSKEGDKILLLYDRKMYSYDLKQASLQVLKWSPPFGDFDFPMYYVESLVSIGS